MARVQLVILASCGTGKEVGINDIVDINEAGFSCGTRHWDERVCIYDERCNAQVCVRTVCCLPRLDHFVACLSHLVFSSCSPVSLIPLSDASPLAFLSLSLSRFFSRFYSSPLPAQPVYL